MAGVRKHRSNAFIVLHCWIDGCIQHRVAKECLFLPLSPSARTTSPEQEEFHHLNIVRERDADGDHDDRGPAC
jgi:hypothetical protein